MQHRKLRPHRCRYQTEGSTIQWILDSQRKPWARTRSGGHHVGSVATIHRRIRKKRDSSSSTPIVRCGPKHEVVEEQSLDEKLPSVATHAGRNILAKDTKSKKSIIGSQPRENHNVFTHYPKDPNCEVCKKTEKTRAKCRIKPKKRVDGIARSTKFGELNTADHKILNVEDESRCGHKYDPQEVWWAVHSQHFLQIS